MRKVILVCGMIASLCFPAGKALAQRNELDRKGMNKRIEELRSRLDEFRQNKTEQTQESEPVVERIEESFEKISVDLENRNDVAVVVLFKDAEYAVILEEPKEAKKPKVKKPVSRNNQKNTVPLSVYDSNRQQEDLARKDRYDELRRRVFLATRRTQKSAAGLQQLVANVR